MTPDKELATTDSFSELEKRDEDQILQELNGNILKEMFYLSKEGKAVVSWIGIKEIARNYGGIDVNLVEKTDLGEQWFVVVKATDKKNSYSMLGASTQAKMMDVYDRDPANPKIKLDTTHKEPDPFVLQKAFSKAQRNSIRALIPETFFAQMIDTWRKGGKPFVPKFAQPVASVTPKQGPRRVESDAKVKEEPEPAEKPSLKDVNLDNLTESTIASIQQSNKGLSRAQILARIQEEKVKAGGLITDEDAVLRVASAFAKQPEPTGFTSAAELPKVPDDFRPKEETNIPATMDEGDVVYDALQEAALDGNLIEVVSPGCLKTRRKRDSEKREFLADRWHDYNDVLLKLGYHWVKDGDNSRWEKQP